MKWCVHAMSAACMSHHLHDQTGWSSTGAANLSSPLGMGRLRVVQRSLLADTGQTGAALRGRRGAHGRTESTGARAASCCARSTWRARSAAASASRPPASGCAGLCRERAARCVGPPSRCATFGGRDAPRALAPQLGCRPGLPRNDHVATACRPSTCGGSLKDGALRAQGQLLAVWRHSVSDRDARTIVAARIPVLVLHGRHDIVAAPRFGEALARRRGAQTQVYLRCMDTLEDGRTCARRSACVCALQPAFGPTRQAACCSARACHRLKRACAAAGAGWRRRA